MDLTLTSAEQSFRDELREWLAAHHPGAEPKGDEYGFEFRRAWQRELNEAGYAGLSWPQEYGGRGATLIEQAIFNEELTRADAPSPANVLGLVMGGPVRHPPRHARAEGALPRADPVGRGDLVPGVLRAGLRLGSRLAEDARRALAATSTSSPGRRCGRRSRTRRSGACSWRAPIRTRRSTRA